MNESSRKVQAAALANLDEGPLHPEPSGTTDTAAILLKYFEESLKSVNRNTLLAFTIIAFLLIPGLQGAFSDWTRNATVEIPYLSLTAELLTAALFSLILFWVFCLRAAAQVTRAREIAQKLRDVNPEVVEVALLFPSIATSSVNRKGLAAGTLALLGVIAWLFLFTSELGFTAAAFGSLSMIIPPGCLFYALKRPL